MAILIRLLHSFREGGRCQFLRRRLIALFFILVLVGDANESFGQADSREYQLKAVLLYNLTQFVEWPNAVFPTNDSPLVIGILGSDPFDSLLDAAVYGEKYHHRPIVVQRFQSVQEAGSCHLLFISSSERRSVGSIFRQLEGRPILTVADFDGFMEAGGMIKFFKSPEDKIRLRINAKAAKDRDLLISAKLLGVAEIVGSEEE